MKLLFLTPQIPYPPHQGTTIRNFNIIKHLAPHHEITLLSFGSTEDLQNAQPLNTLCHHIEVARYPSRTLVHRLLTTLVSPLPDMALRLQSEEMHDKSVMLRERDFDIIQIEGIEMAPYIFDLVTAAHSMPLVFDEHNAEYVLQRTAFESDARHISRWHAAIYSLIQWKKLEGYEREMCYHASQVVTCSEKDGNAIRKLVDFKSDMHDRQPIIRVIPNGVDIDLYVPSDNVCSKPLADLGMVFVGKMDFRPNIDAMTWFCSEIHPRIRIAIPLAHLTIVGQKPSPRIISLRKHPGIKVTGWVDDTRPYVADAAIYVVPLRMGSGTRLKVLEAMAMGKAIVSTTRGIEGIPLTHNREALIADTPEEFARAVIQLLREPDRRHMLGNAARALAVSNYSWKNIIPAFDQIYQDIGKNQAPVSAVR